MVVTHFISQYYDILFYKTNPKPSFLLIFNELGNAIKANKNWLSYLYLKIYINKIGFYQIFYFTWHSLCFKQGQPVPQNL